MKKRGLGAERKNEIRGRRERMGLGGEERKNEIREWRERMRLGSGEKE